MDNVELNMVKELSLGICELRKNSLDAIFDIAKGEKALVDAGLVKPEDFMKFCDAVETIVDYLGIKTVTLFDKNEE